MLQLLKDNTSMLLIGVLLLVMAVMGISLASTKASLATTQAQLTTAQANQLVLQSDLNTATIAIKDAEKEKERLRLDAALLTSALTVREQGRDEVDTTLIDTKAKATAIIEGPHDEATTTWAHTAVPDELNRLLYNAANCANSNSNQDSVCIAAAGADERMRRAGVLRPNQPRSL